MEVTKQRNLIIAINITKTIKSCRMRLDRQLAHESLKMHIKIIVRKSVWKRPLENLQAGWGNKTYLERHTA
jgi:hypothetical protein